MAAAGGQAGLLPRPYPAWLEDAVLYQVYPQSFLDANGDGVGDLAGITAKLDYIQSLGANLVWLNPVFRSPMGDAGYDVSDFRRVDPRYGTAADLARLIAQAHARGMRVVLDLVAGHTSVEHPWFQASARARKNRYTDWYVWTDSVWRQASGSGFVHGFGERDGAYLANFFHFQPALNYGFARPDPAQPWQLPIGHPGPRAVRDEMLDVMRFWLDRGADGFRCDMAYSLVKEDPGRRATAAFWREARAMLDREYPEAVLLSEWSRPARAIAAGFHADFLIHMGTPAYRALFRREAGTDQPPTRPPGHSFFRRRGLGDIGEFLEHYLPHYRRTKGRGLICIPSGNHDLPRLSLGRDARGMEAAFAFLFAMPGIPGIYYGDEIGMRHLSGIPSKEGGYNRTGARTPMQWGPGRNAGFSAARAERLYLPLDPRPGRPTVAAQERDPSSLLNRVRRLAALRRAHPALGAKGDFQPLFARKRRYPFVFLRRSGRERILVALNPAGREARAAFPAPAGLRGASLLEGRGDVRLRAAGRSLHLDLGPVSYAFFESYGTYLIK